VRGRETPGVGRTAPVLPMRPEVLEKRSHDSAPEFHYADVRMVGHCGTHTHPDVQSWLARNPGSPCTTPTSGSWLNMAEVFSIIIRQAIRRGSFTSVQDLIAAIEAFIDGWNGRCHLFTWAKTADEILPHCRPGKRTSFTRHLNAWNDPIARAQI